LSWYNEVRWFHVFAAASWLGEVITINFVLVPALAKFSEEERSRFIAAVFPRVFRLASVLSFTTVASGATLFLLRFGTNWQAVWHTPFASFLAAGAVLGFLLTMFHFVMEPRLSKLIYAAKAAGNVAQSELIHSRLRVIPRAGLGVLAAIVFFMMVGARGL